MPRSFRAASIATTAVAFVLLAGCSSSSDESSGSSAPASTPASTPATSAASSSETTSPETGTAGSSTAAGDGLESALIAVSDVGTGYEKTSTGTTDSPLPCTPDKQPLFKQAVPAQKVQTSFVNRGATVQVGETVAEFSEDSGAEQAFRIGSAGFTCSSGMIGGESVRIAKRASTPGGEVDEIASWDFVAGQLKGTAVIARLDDHIVAMTFSAVGSAGNSVPVAAIVNRALAKAAAND